MTAIRKQIDISKRKWLVWILEIIFDKVYHITELTSLRHFAFLLSHNRVPDTFWSHTISSYVLQPS